MGFWSLARLALRRRCSSRICRSLEALASARELDRAAFSSDRVANCFFALARSNSAFDLSLPSCNRNRGVVTAIAMTAPAMAAWVLVNAIILIAVVAALVVIEVTGSSACDFDLPRADGSGADGFGG